jgi:hypothetical protein
MQLRVNLSAETVAHALLGIPGGQNGILETPMSIVENLMDDRREM